MTDILNRYINFLEDNKLTAFNYPGLSTPNLDIPTNQRISLPPLLKKLYSKIGGQDAEILTCCPYRLLPPNEIPLVQQRLLDHIRHIYGEHWQSYQMDHFDDAGKVKNTLYHPARIPIFQNDNDDYYCLDYAPGADGHIGQVLAVIGTPGPADEPLFLMFEDFEECLQDILADLLDDNPQDLEDFFSDSQEILASYDEDIDDNSVENTDISAQSANHYDLQIRHHIQENISEITAIYHDNTTENIPLDLYHIAPNAMHAFHIFITSGMSHLPMPVETMTSENRRLELLIFLPPEWPVGKRAFADENNYWPVRFLQILASLPQQRQTCLHLHQVIPVSGENADIANTDFSGFLLVPPIHLNPEFARLNTDDGEKILFLAVMPLYAEEMDFILEHGTEALIRKFNQYKINAVIDPYRTNVAEDD